MTERSPVSIEVLVVGSGFSGIGMAIELLRRGEKSFVVLEKASAVGGTWRENVYPGCACDVPSHLYSYSFEPNPNWTRMFAPQAEILEYLNHCADKYEVRPFIRFNAQIEFARFDEARGRWDVRTRSGDVYDAHHLVLGIGALHRPAYPKVEGLETFTGKKFHSAEWDHAYDLRGKRVGIIGTGASAIQFVPKVVASAARVHLFQRTPPWIHRKPDRAISSLEQQLFRRAPALQRLARNAIYWLMEARAFGYSVNPKVLSVEATLARRHITTELGDTELARKVTPTYTPGCKRTLLSGDYYPALRQPNVEVVTDEILRADESSITTHDGQTRELDAIIFGTGFRVTEPHTNLRIEGLNGQTLNDAWAAGVEAYLGTTVSGFPNLFMLMGPNTTLGHSSMIFMIESQIRYAASCMQANHAHGARYLSVKPDAQQRFNSELQMRFGKSVFATGCMSWYLDARGRNSVTWPGFTFEFWWRTRAIDAKDYDFCA